MPALATDKYPPTIKKLFAPRPPLLHVPPLDYPPEKRSTKPVSPVSKWKEIYQEHAQRIREENETTDTAVETTLQKQAKARAKRERAQAESFQRQMEEWLDPSLAEKHEKEVMKDPYCTLFIARLDYDVTEVEVSQSFSRFGAIASIRIIRDNEGKSKGYGFVVFERDTDAATCVRELASTGIKIGPESSDRKPRTALVDIERSRVIRNWKPRRLGGGLGGRGYTQPSQYHLAVASAAASGRRLPQKTRRDNPKFSPYPSAQAPTQGGSMVPPAYGQPAAPAYGLTMAYGLYRAAAPETSVRDKYAKYGTSSTTSYRPASNLRSVRNIRRE